jgi:hypothetical protein
VRIPELVRAERERTWKQSDRLGDAVALIGQVPGGRLAPNGTQQIDHLAGRDPIERVLHPSGEPHSHEADFFRWRVHAARTVAVGEWGEQLSAYSTTAVPKINPSRTDR